MVEKLSIGTGINGDILAWTNAVFEIRGKGVSVGEAEIEKHNESHMVVLPVKVDWHEGNRYCKHLGKGEMAEISNKEELKATGKKVKAIMKSCMFLWIPLSDASVEGEFRNTNSGDLETYLPWGMYEPDGETAENYVAMEVDELTFTDHSVKHSLCVSCAIKTTTLFRLRGICKDSYMGKPIQMYKFNDFNFRHVLCCNK